MLKIGLTGGIGTGKSSVSALFKEWGAYIFDADVVAKDIINNNDTAQSELIAEFGTDVLGADNKIDKKKLARTAFPDEDRAQQGWEETGTRALNMSQAAGTRKCILVVDTW